MTSDNDEIKQKIKDSIPFPDLFRELFPDKWRSKDKSFSPAREETNPSFQCNKDYGYDYGGGQRYDVFALYQLRHGCDFPTAFNDLKARAGITDPPKRSQTKETDEKVFNPYKDGKEVAAYDYRDKTGKVIYQNVRYEPNDPSQWPGVEKTFRPRRPDPNKPGKWLSGLGGTKPVPFGLPELLAATKDELVHICEGCKDVEAMRKMGFLATSLGTASTGPVNLTKHGLADYFKDRHVVFCQDKDDAGRGYAKNAAPILAKVTKSLKIIEMPGDGIKDPADLIEQRPTAAKDIITAAVKLAKPYSAQTAKAETKKKPPAKGASDKSEKLTKFQKLDICLQCLGWQFFFDQNGFPWANIPINGHSENIQVDSEQFNRLFQKEFKAQYYDGVGPKQIEQVTGAVLGGIEKFRKPRHLYVRMCWNATKDKILIDSGRPDWAVYEISPDGWRMIQTEGNPFKRAHKTAAYDCTPDTPRATWDNLFEFLRVTNDNQKTIIKMWLCLALFPGTPRPGLVINGPAGSAKTTMAMKLKKLVDPTTSHGPNRFRKNEDDMIAPLANYAVSVLDNANQMTPEQSDLLCQTITALDDDKRKYFTQGDTHSIDCMCTWIITGVSNPGKKSDFLRRVFLLETELIPDNERIPDSKIDELAHKYTAGIQA